MRFGIAWGAGKAVGVHAYKLIAGFAVALTSAVGVGYQVRKWVEGRNEAAVAPPLARRRKPAKKATKKVTKKYTGRRK